jgi:hypothetical protein
VPGWLVEAALADDRGLAELLGQLDRAQVGAGAFRRPGERGDQRRGMGDGDDLGVGARGEDEFGERGQQVTKGTVGQLGSARGT